MEQLKLTNKELESIKFKAYIIEGDEMNLDRECFKIETLNGYFYYNPHELVYTWYHKTVIGDVSNHVHLDITKKAELFVLLQCFRADFKLII